MLGTHSIVVTPKTPAGVEMTSDAMTFEFVVADPCEMPAV
jgi:hypothetical protein